MRQVTGEVQYQLGRISHHASIAVFGGNNEVRPRLERLLPCLTAALLPLCKPHACMHVCVEAMQDMHAQSMASARQRESIVGPSLFLCRHS